METFARSTTLTHPLGTQIITPLLVPSFSSKGFHYSSKHRRSEAYQQIEVAKEFITDSILISAYDAYHKFIPKFESIHSVAEITFIDSGGYEVSDNYDLSASYHTRPKVRKWSEKLLRQQLDKWHQDRAAVLISYDGNDRISFDEQIENALKLFSLYPNQLNTLLLKPHSSDSNFISIPDLQTYITQLNKFSIIGVTEKELGCSLYDRMKNIALLRKELDNAKITSPLHIFGGLDPITSSLYFLCGAEIFDGLTWLRYSYHKGFCYYWSNYGVFSENLGVRQRDDKIKAKSLVDNIYYIGNLRGIMKTYAVQKSFDVFSQAGDIQEIIQKAYTEFINNFEGK